VHARVGVQNSAIPGFWVYEKKEIEMRRSYIGYLVVAVSAVLVFAAVTAAVAQAEEAPFWSVNKARLGNGETRFTTAKAYKSFVIVAPPVSSMNLHWTARSLVNSTPIQMTARSGNV
jgi:hypothetical protein